MRLTPVGFFVLSIFALVSARAGDTEVVFRGRVLSTRDRSPIEHGWVQVSEPGSGRAWTTQVHNGFFSLKVPSGREYLLVIQAPGFNGFRSRELSVFPGMGPHSFLLEPFVTLKGRVLDPEGRGLAGAMVAVLGAGGRFRESFRTDKNGGFLINLSTGDELPTGGLSLRVSHLGFESVGPISVFPPLDVPLEVTMDPPDPGSVGSVTGRVTGPQGRPLEGAIVMLRCRRSAELFERLQTDPRGRYRLDTIPPGKCVLEFHASGFSQSTLNSTPIQVEAGRNLQVNFQFLGKEVLEGVVKDDAGNLLAGVDLFLDNSAEAESLQPPRRFGSYSVHTEKEGNFQFSGIEAGRYRLIVRKSGSEFQEKRLSLEVPTPEPVVITLEQGVTLRAVVVDSGNRPLTDFAYEIHSVEENGSGFSRRVILLNDFSFTIPGLKAESYQITIVPRDGRRHRGIVDLNRGTSVLLHIPPPPELDLVVGYASQ